MLCWLLSCPCECQLGPQTHFSPEILLFSYIRAHWIWMESVEILLLRPADGNWLHRYLYLALLWGECQWQVAERSACLEINIKKKQLFVIIYVHFFQSSRVMSRGKLTFSPTPLRRKLISYRDKIKSNHAIFTHKIWAELGNHLECRCSIWQTRLCDLWP